MLLALLQHSDVLVTFFQLLLIVVNLGLVVLDLQLEVTVLAGVLLSASQLEP